MKTYFNSVVLLCDDDCVLREWETGCRMVICILLSIVGLGFVLFDTLILQTRWLTVIRFYQTIQFLLFMTGFLEKVMVCNNVS